jgi:phage-related protein
MYGGTKEEMQRLLDDAEKLTGKKYDVSNFADITEAIHAIQEKMGIAGATAKEASETIEGSLNMTKAAWQNLLTGLADTEADHDRLIGNFIDSVKTFAGNVIPVAMTALEGVAQLVTEIGKMLVSELPPMLETLIPAIIEGATGLINSVVEILPSLIDLLVNTAIPQFLTAVGSIIETLISALPTILGKLGSALISALPTLMGFVGKMITGIADFIQTNLPIVTEKAKDLVGGLGQKIQENLLFSPSFFFMYLHIRKGVFHENHSYFFELH